MHEVLVVDVVPMGISTFQLAEGGQFCGNWAYRRTRRDAVVTAKVHDSVTSGDIDDGPVDTIERLLGGDWVGRSRRYSQFGLVYGVANSVKVKAQA